MQLLILATSAYTERGNDLATKLVLEQILASSLKLTLKTLKGVSITAVTVLKSWSRTPRWLLLVTPNLMVASPMLG
jgi:hypothetical protein